MKIQTLINEAREILNKAFRINDVPKRNLLLDQGLIKLKEIESLVMDEKEKEQISNIKVAYSREYLKKIRPHSLEEDFTSFTILIRMNINYKDLFVNNPELETNLNVFLTSLMRSPHIQKYIDDLKQKINNSEAVEVTT